MDGVYPTFYSQSDYRSNSFCIIASFCYNVKQKFPLRTKLRFPLLRASTLSVSWQFRLQFPFVFRRLNPCRCFHPAHPCFLLQLVTFVYRFHFWLLWAFHSTAFTPLPFSFLTSAVFAFFRLLQFWILTTQPLFLLFPFLPVSASQWLPQCSALSFDPSVFPVLSCLVSRAFFPGFGTQLRCMFPFALPRFAPTAVPRVLAFFSAFASLPAFSVPLPLSFVRFCFPSGYSAFCFFLSVLPVSASQWLPRCCLSAFASLLSPFFPA